MEEFCKLKLFLLFFLIFVSKVYAQEVLNLPRWYLKQYDEEIKGIWKEYQPIALIAVLLSFTVASLLYSFGFILQNDRLKNYAMAEFLEAVASLLMVILFVVLLQILASTFFPVVTQGTTPEQKQIVEIGPFAYLDAKLNLIQQVSNKTYTATINLLYILDFMSSVKIAVPELGKTTSVPKLLYNANFILGKFGFFYTSILAPIMNTLIAALTEIGEYIYSGLKALSFQRALLKFFAESSITVFLPLGVVLRIFPPTRGAGGMLIAMAFSFFFIFPFVYLVFYLPSGSNSFASVLLSNLQKINSKLDEINSDKILAFIKVSMNSGALAIFTTFVYSIKLILDLLSSSTLLNLFISFYPTYLFATSIIPVIAGALALTFMTTLSDLFGENAVKYGQRLIGRII
ncbi:MAG: hypothetical protein ACP5HJ_00530 [Candidatus Micrarchaeia archaeon]